MGIELVVNQNEQEIAAKNAATELELVTSELAANILRIVAGAGKPHQLLRQCEEFAIAYRALLPFCGSKYYPYGPNAAITMGATDFDWRRHKAGYDRPTPEQRWANNTLYRDNKIEETVQAALRWRAAQLAANPTHESTEHSKLVFAAAEIWKRGR